MCQNWRHVVYHVNKTVNLLGAWSQWLVLQSPLARNRGLRSWIALVACPLLHPLILSAPLKFWIRQCCGWYERGREAMRTAKVSARNINESQTPRIDESALTVRPAWTGRPGHADYRYVPANCPLAVLPASMRRHLRPSSSLPAAEAPRRSLVSAKEPVASVNTGHARF